MDLNSNYDIETIKPLTIQILVGVPAKLQLFITLKVPVETSPVMIKFGTTTALLQLLRAWFSPPIITELQELDIVEL